MLSPWLGREVAKREEASHLKASAIRGRYRAVLGPPAPIPHTHTTPAALEDWLLTSRPELSPSGTRGNGCCILGS